MLDFIVASEWCGRYAVDEVFPECPSAIEWCLKYPTVRQPGNGEHEWRREPFARQMETMLHYRSRLVTYVNAEISEGSWGLEWLKIKIMVIVIVIVIGHGPIYK